jgi:ATP-dependent Clp protease ATP-binding subunit ClpB
MNLSFQMEDDLKNRVVGQDHVVTAISDAVRISRAGLQAPNRPVASVLFMGPTGVGKVCHLHSFVPMLAD